MSIDSTTFLAHFNSGNKAITKIYRHFNERIKVQSLSELTSLTGGLWTGEVTREECWRRAIASFSLSSKYPGTNIPSTGSVGK
jgi:hypothetical protein